MKDKKKNVLILGATGMLGSEVLRVFHQRDYAISANLRNKKSAKLFTFGHKVRFFKFDAGTDNINILQKFVTANTVIINCIGVIKPKINETNNHSVLNAININSVFPHQWFNKFSRTNRIYQIATDCVYDGLQGKYNEDSKHNPTDVYGKTKSLGEVDGKNFFNLRTSIIGKELGNSFSLYEWFLKQKKNSILNGYTNHLWNGLTTNAFANVLISIIENKIIIPNTIHLTPKNTISKFKLLKLFNKCNKQKNVKINPSIASSKINRTLTTKYEKLLLKIWKQSTYKKTPTLEMLVDKINI